MLHQQPFTLIHLRIAHSYLPTRREEKTTCGIHHSLNYIYLNGFLACRDDTALWWLHTHSCHAVSFEERCGPPSPCLTGCWTPWTPHADSAATCHFVCGSSGQPGSCHGCRGWRPGQQPQPDVTLLQPDGQAVGGWEGRAGHRQSGPSTTSANFTQQQTTVYFVLG